jgi:hypothetical protein
MPCGTVRDGGRCGDDHAQGLRCAHARTHAQGHERTQCPRGTHMHTRMHPHTHARCAHACRDARRPALARVEAAAARQVHGRQGGPALRPHARGIAQNKQTNKRTRNPIRPNEQRTNRRNAALARKRSKGRPEQNVLLQRKRRLLQRKRRLLQRNTGCFNATPAVARREHTLRCAAPPTLPSSTYGGRAGARERAARPPRARSRAAEGVARVDGVVDRRLGPLVRDGAARQPHVAGG